MRLSLGFFDVNEEEERKYAYQLTASAAYHCCRLLS